MGDVHLILLTLRRLSFSTIRNASESGFTTLRAKLQQNKYISFINMLSFLTNEYIWHEIIYTPLLLMFQAWVIRRKATARNRQILIYNAATNVRSRGFLNTLGKWTRRPGIFNSIERRRDGYARVLAVPSWVTSHHYQSWSAKCQGL